MALCLTLSWTTTKARPFGWIIGFLVTSVNTRPGGLAKASGHRFGHFISYVPTARLLRHYVVTKCLLVDDQFAIEEVLVRTLTKPLDTSSLILLATLPLLGCATTPTANPTAGTTPASKGTPSPSSASPAAAASAAPAATTSSGKPVRVLVDAQEVDVKGQAGKADRGTGPAATISILSGNSTAASTPATALH